MLKTAIVTSVVFSGFQPCEGDVTPKNSDIDFHRGDLVLQIVIDCPTHDQEVTKFGIISYSTIDRFYCTQNLSCYKQKKRAENEVCEQLRYILYNGAKR